MGRIRFWCSCLVLVGCGRSELPAECRDPEVPDRAAEPFERCEQSPEVCRVEGGAVPIHRFAKGRPDVVFTGRDILILAFDACGAELSARTVDGEALWIERLSEGKSGQLAWHPGSAGGLAVVGAEVWRLDGDGRPTPSEPLPAAAAAAFAVEDGFAAVLADGSYVHLGGAERIITQLDLPPRIHPGPSANGIVRYFTADDGANNQSATVFDVSDPTPRIRDEVFNGHGPVVTSAELDDELYSLSVLSSDDPDFSFLFLKRWGVGPLGGRGDAFFRTPSFEQTRATLLTAAGALFSISPHIDTERRLSFASIDVVQQPEQLGEVHLLDAEPVAYHPSAAATPRGFVTAWVRDGDVPSTHLQLVDCCL